MQRGKNENDDDDDDDDDDDADADADDRWCMIDDRCAVAICLSSMVDSRNELLIYGCVICQSLIFLGGNALYLSQWPGCPAAIISDVLSTLSS